MSEESYSVVISGNVESCRTEAEVSDQEGNSIGVVYEDGDGWHTELSYDRPSEESAEAALRLAKQALSQYVNRRGENPPRGATVGVLALWLMQKIDGTAMGRKFGSQSK